MAETKFLNLDELADQDEIVIRLNNKDHKYKAMSVRDFAWVQAHMKNALKDGLSEEEQMDGMCTLIARSFPTLTKDELLDLDFSRLMKLTNWINTLSTKGAEAAVEAAQEASGNEQTTTQVQAPQS